MIAMQQDTFQVLTLVLLGLTVLLLIVPFVRR